MTDHPPFFPPPDQTLNSGFPVEVIGGAVSRIQVSQTLRKVSFSVLVHREERITGFRFQVPIHARIVREFLKAGNIKRLPRGDVTFDVQEGTFLVSFKGICIGKDNTPIEVPPGMPNEILVLEVGTVMLIGVSDLGGLT